MFWDAHTEGRITIKKQLACPVCGFNRLVDASQNTKSELSEESQIKPGWRPEYYAKCKKCGKQIVRIEVPGTINSVLCGDALN